MTNQTNTAVQALTNDAMMAVAPSIFAEHAHPKASDRYSFVPTIKAIDYLRNDGWKPIWADEVQAKAENMIGRITLKNTVIKSAPRSADASSISILI